jgi:hypothetical protein
MLLETLPAFHRRLLKNELEPGEVVVYFGRPSFRPTAGFWAFTPLYVCWTALWLGVPGVFITMGVGGALGLVQNIWEGGEPMSRLASLGIAMFATPHMFIGVCSLLLPIVRWFELNRTVHAVTNRRLLSVYRSISVQPVATSYTADKLTSLDVTRHGSLTSLQIGVGERVDSDGDTVKEHEWWSAVEDGARAEAAVRTLMAQRPLTVQRSEPPTHTADRHHDDLPWSRAKR